MVPPMTYFQVKCREYLSADTNPREGYTNQISAEILTTMSILRS